ncbi:MAG TPA: serine/threonine-protein kinase [Luteitalea sp.]|nr:serine/threonine-protein kinase [Luteitalea sp.]
MDATRWERVQELFHAAAALRHEDRGPFLAASCEADPELLDAVTSLLDEDGQSDTPLERDLPEVAWQLLSGPASLLPFPQFGRYTVIERLGEGGMGVVYLAEREDIESRVAIKVLRDAWVSTARLERFGAEQRVLARLNHPCIGRIYDADTLADGTPWFAMEYVDGLPITQFCVQHALSLDERLRLFRDVCEAVQYAHQHLVVHRDLKPSNVLVSSEGRVKLLDFGIARQLEGIDAVDQTVTRHWLMTPAYAAPEQLSGAPTGVHTDVYGLGGLLYELLTGRRPFDLAGASPSEAETIITTHEPVRPSLVDRRSHVRLRGGGTAWDDLDVLCLAALRKEPERRYPTVEALIRDVDHYMRREPLEARPDTFGYRSGKFVRRHWQVLVAAAVVVVAIAGLLTFYTSRLGAARNTALAQAARTERIQRFMLSLFSADERHDAPAADLRVLTLLDRGAKDAQKLEDEPAVQSELFHTLGTIYQQLGRHEEADRLLSAALARRQALHGASHPDVAESLIAVGMLRVDQADLERAERLLREAYAVSQQGATRSTQAHAAAALGRALREKGSYDEAVQVLNEAVRLYDTAAAPPEDGTAARTALANTHFYAGRLDVAENQYQHILASSRRVHGGRHPSVAHDLLNVAAVRQSRADYASAERHAREALHIFENWYGRIHPETASAMNILGQALRYQRKFDEAAQLLREALATQEHVYGPSHPRVAFALNELGGLAQQLEHFDEAETAYRRALAIYTTVYDGKHARVGVAMVNLASVLISTNQPAQAETLIRTALAAYGELLPPTHINIGIAQIRLGVALAAQHRDADAEAALVAGRRIIVQQTSPSARWLSLADQTLAAVRAARPPATTGHQTKPPGGASVVGR